MSINVYLKGDEVRKLEGFTTKKRQGGKPVQEWDEHELSGVKLSHDKGRWYIMLHEPTEPVPATVVDIVEEISFYEWISLRPSREAGIYRHESAEAEVEPDKIGGDNRLKIRIRAKKMEDLLELYRKIRTGSIRPEQSYEGQQGGMSRAELEAELERMQRDADRALEILKANLRTLYRELENGWPFCTKVTVRDKIDRILNKYRV